LDLEESGQGASAAHAVVMMAELDALVADLPREASPQIVGTRTPEVVSSVFGDIKVSGGTVPRRASTVFGDVDVILAEGVDGELHSIPFAPSLVGRAFWWGGPTGTLRCVLVIQ